MKRLLGFTFAFGIAFGLSIQQSFAEPQRLNQKFVFDVIPVSIEAVANNDAAFAVRGIVEKRENVVLKSNSPNGIKAVRYTINGKFYKGEELYKEIAKKHGLNPNKFQFQQWEKADEGAISFKVGEEFIGSFPEPSKLGLSSPYALQLAFPITEKNGKKIVNRSNIKDVAQSPFEVKTSKYLHSGIKAKIAKLDETEKSGKDITIEEFEDVINELVK